MFDSVKRKNYSSVRGEKYRRIKEVWENCMKKQETVWKWVSKWSYHLAFNIYVGDIDGELEKLQRATMSVFDTVTLKTESEIEVVI